MVVAATPEPARVQIRGNLDRMCDDMNDYRKKISDAVSNLANVSLVIGAELCSDLAKKVLLRHCPLIDLRSDQKICFCGADWSF
jgi:hypothetical protein